MEGLRKEAQLWHTEALDSVLSMEKESQILVLTYTLG
jgi:hypothetical protein